MRRITEIIDRVVAQGIYNYWISLRMNEYKLLSWKMQPAFYILFMGWCLSTVCILVKVLHNRILRKRY
jgi:hypothetical protein